MHPIGRIEKVELRDIWPHEANDFTKWLATDEGLQLLADAVGIELEEPEPESSVGAFSVDILAKVAGSDQVVVIENQLEDTNHDHLGKLVTYAAGTGASYAIWIVKHAREEHQKALEWLNGHTDIDLGFFLVEIEAVKIGDSLPAPMFTVVEKPNDWAKTTKASSTISDTKKLYLQYWTHYVDYVAQHPEYAKIFHPHKPKPQNWTNLAVGSSAYHLGLNVTVDEGRIGAFLYIPKDKELGAKAEANKGLFKERTGIEPVVINGEVASGLRFYRDNCAIANNVDKWDEFLKWQLDTLAKVREVVFEIDL